jgi:hypothetical protein
MNCPNGRRICPDCQSKCIINKSPRCKSCSNHHRMGTYHCPSTSLRMMENKNPMWKGEYVGYLALHEWVKKRMLKPKSCNKCKTNNSIDLSNISGKYKREISDWEWLCRKCHMNKDGRINNLKQYQTKKLILNN